MTLHLPTRSIFAVGLNASLPTWVVLRARATSGPTVTIALKPVAVELSLMRFSKVFLVALCACFVSVGHAGQRVPWTGSRVKGSPEPAKPYGVERVYPALQFNQPVELVALPGTDKMLLLEVDGKVFTFDDRPDCARADLAIDLSGQMAEFRRALSIRPHPGFATNGQIFVCYAGDPVARPDGTRLSRFQMNLDGIPTIDPDSEEILLTWASGGHNGCAIRFDQQGLLYFSAGDGARPYPPDEYDVSQDLSDLRSSICRINVDHAQGDRGYSIPADNPFVNRKGARPEIWAYGFRNPWRFNFDPVTGQLLCGDVGWELWELVFHVESGGNYGWSIYEGPQPIRSDIVPGPTPIRKPLVAYPHTQGLSVTGGIVYRGGELTELDGTYLYGDYVTGLLWGLKFEGEQVTYNEVLAETGMPIISFAESREGEALVMSFNGGIYKLVENSAASSSPNFPRRLSETGLFADTRTLDPAPGVFAYSVSAKAFEGDAQSQFVVGIPGEDEVVTDRRRRNWKFPMDTVFAKTLSREVVVEGDVRLRRIETQLLHYTGIAWQPYCYVWDESQNDAVLIDADGGSSELEVPGGRGEGSTRVLQWRHHSRSECRACHTNQTGGAVAFSFENLKSVNGFEDAASPVAQFVELGILDKSAPQNWELRTMVDPQDETQPIETRARSYLHANCAHCHCRGGGGTVALDIEFAIPTDSINAIDFPTTQGTFGLEDAKVVTPGDPYSSVLFYRMATSGNGHMPKLWIRDNDDQGLRLIHDWIISLRGPDAEQPSGDPSAGVADTRTALRLFHQLLTADSEESLSVALRVKDQASPVTMGLLERFLPEEQRAKRLGDNINAEEILALRGDARSGREQFLKSNLLQCRSCHRLEAQGMMVGPDLDGIGGKRSRSELLESMLHPSNKIEPEFASHAIVTADDQVVVGLLLSRDAEKVVLRSADGKTHSIPHEDIVHQTQQSKSLMPEGLAAEMTAEDLANLLEFLVQLK